jgi:DNA-binding transcriptional LysR family regulator
MNLRALRMFVTTAESGGLGRACARLNLSQPAASRQIHALEAEFGLALFHRVGRQLALTSAGKSLLRQSRQILTDADLLAEQARALKEGREGTLRVCATAQMMAAFLTPFLPRYRRRHPGIEVQLIERGAARGSSQLDRGEADVAMMRAGDSRFPGRLLFPLHVLAVVLKTHRLARHAVVDVTDLAKEPLLMLTTDFGTRTCFDAACESAQVSPRVRFECTVAHALTGLAGAGYGIAIVPSIAVMPAESLRAVPIVLRGAAIGHWEAACWDPRRVVPAYVDAFVSELAAYARTTFPGRQFVRRAPRLPTPPG